jgi:carboxylesterase
MRLTLRPPPPGDGDKAPFFARAAGTRAVLCLHGFTGTPFEVRPLAEALAAQGFTVAAPLLAGHGHSVEALAATRWPDWLASAERALLELRDNVAGAPVAVAGFSLGGLLALRLARLHAEKIAALAVMAAPLRLSPFHASAVRAIARLPRFLRRGPLAVLPKTRGYDVTDPEMQRRNPGLSGMPLAGVESLMELGEVVRGDLAEVHAPTLVVHGALDHTVPLEDSLELAGRLGAEEIERLWLPASGHLVAIDVERRALAEAVGRFFLRHLGAGERAGPGEAGGRDREEASR